MSLFNPQLAILTANPQFAQLQPSQKQFMMNLISNATTQNVQSSTSSSTPTVSKSLITQNSAKNQATPKNSPSATTSKVVQSAVSKIQSPFTKNLSSAAPMVTTPQRTQNTITNIATVAPILSTPQRTQNTPQNFTTPKTTNLAAPTASPSSWLSTSLFSTSPGSLTSSAQTISHMTTVQSTTKPDIKKIQSMPAQQLWAYMSTLPIEQRKVIFEQMNKKK